MPITYLLEQNCRLHGDDICLVEINPEVQEKAAGDLEGIRAHGAESYHPLSP